MYFPRGGECAGFDGVREAGMLSGYLQRGLRSVAAKGLREKETRTWAAIHAEWQYKMLTLLYYNVIVRKLGGGRK